MDAATLLAIGKRYNASVALTLTALEVFAAGGQIAEMTLAELGAASGLSKQTLVSALHILDAMGMAVKQSKGTARLKVSLNFHFLDNTSSSLINIDDVPDLSKILTNPPVEDIDYDSSTPFNQVSDAFMEAAQVGFHDDQRWVEACNQLVSIGATREDVLKATRELSDKHLRMSGPWSIIKAARMVIGERKRKENGNGHKPEFDGIWEYGNEPDWMKVGWKKPGDNGNHQEEEDKEYPY